MDKGQSSIEFLLAIPIVFLIAIFIAGEFSNLTKTTVALASAKESLYEKTISAEKALMVKKLEYLICGSNMYINILTSPAATGYSQDELDGIGLKIEKDARTTSGIEGIEITLNQDPFQETCS